MTQGTLGIEDRAFWSDPFGTRDRVERPLARAGGEHIVLDAPSRVDLHAAEGTLPAVVLRVAPNDPAHAIGFARHAVLVATALESNSTLAGVLQDPEDAPPRLDTGGLDGTPPSGTRCEAYLVDLRERLALPWDRPATLVVRLLFRDRLVGRARVALEERAAEYRDPEAERYLEALHRTPSPAAVWPVPADPLPSYDRDGSPPLPAGLGIALAAERVVPLRPSTRCILRGSFRLPIRHRDLTPPDAPAPLLRRRCTAVVPLSVVVIGSRYPAPLVWRLAVPTFAPVEQGGAAPVATGHFAFDMQSLVNLRGIAQTYFLHAFSGEHAAEPAAMALVDVRHDG